MEDSRVVKLESDVSELKTRIAVVESNIKELKEDLDSIKDNTTWILRLIVGGLIGALLTFVYNGGINL